MLSLQLKIDGVLGKSGNGDGKKVSVSHLLRLYQVT